MAEIHGSGVSETAPEGSAVPTGDARQRRRSPEEAEKEILDAAKEFLRKRPFREMTVGELMSRTGLSRPAFYFYFRDRYEVVERLLEEIGAALLDADRPWLEGGKGRGRREDGSRGGVREAREEMRASINAGVRVFASHGPVLRAVSDAAVSDPEVERAYKRGFVEGFVEPIAARVRMDAEAGLVRGELDPEQTARALVWMVERYALDTLGYTPPAVEPDRVASTIENIWLRTLYGPAAG